MTADAELAEVAYATLGHHMRTGWRRGRVRHIYPVLERAISTATGQPATETIMLDTLSRAVRDRWAYTIRGGLHSTNLAVWPTHSARVTWTLDDAALDHPLPRVADLGDHDLTTLIASTLRANLTQALAHNPTRTVEYLLRARHRVEPGGAAQLAAALADDGLLDAGGRLLVQLTATPATRDPDRLTATLRGTLQPATRNRPQ